MPRCLYVKKELINLIFDLNRLVKEKDVKTAISLLHKKSSDFKRYEVTDYLRVVYD